RAGGEATGGRAAERGRPCRFRLCSSGGARCPCPGFEAADDAGLLCKCGHKASMHRSDTAEAGFEAFSSMNRACHTMDWTDTPGLVRIEDDELLAKLQEALDHTHKPKDNWTRDRGCALHGVNGCDAKCCSKNKAPVPTRYKLLTAYRNQNEDLWQKYSMLKTAIREECRRPRGLEDTLPPMTVHKVTTSGMSLSSDLDEECNEYYLFHGSSSQKCTSIASTNFRTDLAGAGATWKEKGKAVGTPLYGFGVYFAEMDHEGGRVFQGGGRGRRHPARGRGGGVLHRPGMPRHVRQDERRHDQRDRGEESQGGRVRRTVPLGDGRPGLGLEQAVQGGRSLREGPVLPGILAGVFSRLRLSTMP
ncbi:unnamed protein product, partial [Prorocentrum cordatum]